MVFSSYLFLFAFLPACVFTYFLVPKRAKNACLVAWSYLFYGWGAPKVLPLLIGLTVVNYVLAKRLSRSPDAPSESSELGTKRRVLMLGIGVNLAGLLYFKYANFFVGEVNRMLGGLGVTEVGWTQVALPIGISFFTFHYISYLVDVYRGIVTPASNFIDFALYIALFPQLIAGPIIRYHDIGDQIRARRHSVDLAFAGIVRFCLGLAKKVLLADAIGNVADNVFKLGLEQVSTPYAWLGIVSYAYQIYFDFSGYSDMAIGLGMIFGFRIPENFDHPYASRTITEFWRRWHISLSRWMRDYLYIPLGGNRGGAFATYRNLWIVFILSGFWHGASWTFVVWGMFHGLFLTLDRLFWEKAANKLPKVLAVAVNFVVVLIGWVFFRSETLSGALAYLGRMFGLTSRDPLALWPAQYQIIHNRGAAMFAVATVLSFYPVFLPLLARRNPDESAGSAPRELLCFAAALGCLMLSVFALATTDYNPFIYYRF